MPEHGDFQATQHRFAAHIRDPDTHPAPTGIEDRRLAIYRELFFNNVEGFLSSTFPVLRSLYTEDQWREMVRAFYARHRCQTPYFLEISREFIDYLQSGHDRRACDPPCMFELAHYEWVELALSVSVEEPDLGRIDVNGDLLTGRPVISPLAWLLTYRYPVHRIGPDYLPDTLPDEPTCIIARRGSDDAIHFAEVNAVTARLLQLIEHEAMSGIGALDVIASELPATSRDTVVDGGREILYDLRAQEVLLGTLRMDEP